MARPVPPALVPDVLGAWFGVGLPRDAEATARAEAARLTEAFQTLPPPPQGLQANDFAPLLEALADD